MSIYYAPRKMILAADLFDGRLEKFGIDEHRTDETTNKHRCLTDGQNYVWVTIDGRGFLWVVGKFPGGKILNVVAEVFDTDFVSEYEAEFWGFSTQEEFDAWQDKMAKEDDCAR